VATAGGTPPGERASVGGTHPASAPLRTSPPVRVPTSPPAGGPGRRPDFPGAGSGEPSTGNGWDWRQVPRRAVAALLLACRWMLHNPGWGVSLALHGVAVVAVAYLVVRAQFDDRSRGIEAVFNQPGEAVAFDHVGLEASVNTEASDAPVVPQVGFGEQGGAGDEASELADLMNSSGSGSGQSSGDGQEGGREPGLGAAFFGSQAEGKSFVYVVDMSGSMFGPRFERAKTELCKSLGNLKNQQKFYVFFFSDKTLPMLAPRPPRGLLPASKSNKDKATRWIRTREPGGLTNPLPALRQALEMKPEVIFLLTDGEVEDPAGLRAQITKLNKSRTTIHTIAFESEEGEQTLRAIAEDHRGTYRFVR